MPWLCFAVILFSALTLYFSYGEYKKNKFSKKTFTAICIMEVVVIVTNAVLLIGAL